MNREKGVRHNVNVKKVYTAIQVHSGCIPKSKGGGGNEMKGPVQQEVDQGCRVSSGGSLGMQRLCREGDQDGGRGSSA